MKDNDLVFDSNYIFTLAEQLNPQYIDGLYHDICEILSVCINDICKVKPIITGYDFQIVNECVSFSEVQNSSLDIFLMIKSPQLELSAINLNKNFLKKFLNNLKLSWQKATYKPKKRKRKKAREHEQDKNLKIDTGNNYTINTFKISLLKELSKYVTNKTTIVITNYGITLYSKEDFGRNINIYIAFNNSNNHKLFNSNSYKLLNVDFGTRFNLLMQKDKLTNNKFYETLRIFNNLYINVMGEPLNQLLIESILNNCSNELFQNSPIYQRFIKIFNFINISSWQKFKSITNNNISIVDDKLILQNQIFQFSKFLKIIAKYL